MRKIQGFLLLILFFSIPLMHSHIFEFFWMPIWIYVDGNYEFTKVMTVNIISWIIISISLLTLWRKRKNIIVPTSIYILVLILILSSYFSLTPFVSIFWNASKSHGSIMFLNLIGIFIVLINIKREFLQKLILTMILSSVLVAIIWIKEFYFPAFDYWWLSNRALSTLGNPNYLALYILMIIPFLITHTLAPYPSYEGKEKRILKYILLLLLIFTLILTKSIWWILLCIIYLLYKITPTLTAKYKKILFWIISLGGIAGISYLIYDFSFITKLHSFLSRFFIWTTTTNIIFSDLKTLLTGWGFWTLEFIFDSFKSPYLYLFENFWFTADRPHNIFLNFFYHLGILGLAFIVYLLFIIIKTYKKSPYYESIILFFIFTLFNFPWITHYLIIVLIWAIIYKENYKTIKENNIIKTIALTVIIAGSILWTLFSMQYYSEENKLYKNTFYLSKNNIYKNIKESDFENKILKNQSSTIIDTCTKLIQYSSSVENYFHCWNILWNENKEISKQYYTKWLQKIPDLWNNDSPYYSNPLIKYFIDWRRFFSPKYSNIEEILKRVWE